MGALKKYEEKAQLEKDLNLSGLRLLKDKLLETSGSESVAKHFNSFMVNEKGDLENLTLSLIRLFGYNWTELLKFQTDDIHAPTMVPKFEDIVPFVIYIEPGNTGDLSEASDNKWVQWSPDESLDLIPNAIFTNFKTLKVFGKEGVVDPNLEISWEQLFNDLEQKNYKSKEFKKWKNIYSRFNSRKVYFNKALNRQKKINNITGLEYQKKFGNEPYAIPPKGIGEDGKGYQRLFKTQKGLPFFEKEVIDFGHPSLPIENKLIWGDNLAVMRDLPDETFDLIYIDPPFFSGRDYNFVFNDKSEVKTFTDIWDEGLDGYIIWMNARLWEMKRLLKTTGSLIVHLDWHAVHYIKCELDKIFGYNNFRCDIQWRRGKGQTRTASSQVPRNHDSLLWYSKSESSYYKRIFKPYSDKTLKMYKYDDNDGRGPYRAQMLRTYGVETIEKFKRENKIFKSSTGKEYLKQYLTDKPGVSIDSIWEDIGGMAHGAASEKLGYPTQKPEMLLERIVKAASPEDGFIADFFCGGGTTAAVAEKLGRKWLTTDISRIAVATARDRISDIYNNSSGIDKISQKPRKSFALEYHGSYEKKDILAMGDEEHVDFVLKCYGAEYEKDGQSIHGYKSDSTGRLTAVHVDLSRKKIERETIEKFHRAIEKRGDDYENGGVILCWGYTKSALNYVKKAQKDAYGSSLKIVQIDLVDIDGPDFTDSNVRFLNTPTPNFQIIDQQGLTVDLDATTSLGQDGREVIYYQWDFDFKKTFKPMSKISFTKDKDGDGNPLNDNRIISYEFPESGKYKIALRIYDEDGGTSQVVKEVEV